jgi:CRISPR-associated endonuclease/helicase Cas3
LQGRGNWREIQKKSVSIRLTKIKPWNLRELAKGVYQWTRHYDPFLGYMDGVINQK